MSVMLVRADRLADAPLSFQEYVEDFFVEDVVFGVPVWRARRENDRSTVFSRNSGIAPSHSVDLMHYEKKWEEGFSLTDWIYSQSAKTSGIFVEFY